MALNTIHTKFFKICKLAFYRINYNSVIGKNGATKFYSQLQALQAETKAVFLNVVSFVIQCDDHNFMPYAFNSLALILVMMASRGNEEYFRSFSRDVITFYNPKLKSQSNFLSSLGIKSGIFISVYNFTARYRASFGNQSILNFREEVHDTNLRSRLLKIIYLSHDFEPF